MCSSTIIFDLFESTIRGRALGIFQALEFFGSFIGAPIGSYMVGVIDFRGVFFTASILMILAFLVAFLSKSIHQTDAKNAEMSSELYIKKVLPSHRNWDLTVAYIDSFSRMFVWAGINATFFPIFANLELGINVELIGLIVGIRTVGIIVATAASGHLSDKLGRKPIAILGMLLEVGGLCAHVYASTFETLMTIAFAEGLGVGMILTSMMVLLSEVAPIKYRGGAIGIDRTFMDLGGLIGPLFFMAIYELTSSSYTFLFGAIIFMFNIAIMLTSKPPIPRKENDVIQGT